MDRFGPIPGARVSDGGDGRRQGGLGAGTREELGRFRDLETVLGPRPVRTRGARLRGPRRLGARGYPSQGSIFPVTPSRVCPLGSVSFFTLPLSSRWGPTGDEGSRGEIPSVGVKCRTFDLRPSSSQTGPGASVTARARARVEPAPAYDGGPPP